MRTGDLARAAFSFGRPRRFSAPPDRKHGYTVPVLLGTRSTPNDYNIRMTPTHYLLDGRGEILSKQDGFHPGDETRLEQEIQKAIGP